MGTALSSVFSLLVAAAGWYYMFYSRAATRLAGVEDDSANKRRQRLRQLNGFTMFLLAVGVYAGLNTVDPHSAPSAFVTVWLAVFALLLVIVLLAMFDLRLTWRLRHRRRP